MSNSPNAPWWRQLTGYHWFVFAMASLAWMFDCLDQQLFLLARDNAVRSLLEPGTSDDVVRRMGAIAQSIFVAGWALGGLIFGALGDRIGRAKTLAITVLMYSLCTGLSAFAQDYTQFAIYRAITGLGVGGVFGLAVALVADALPEGARPKALGLLQTLSAVGNVTAGACAMALSGMDPAKSWKYLFWIGAAPAFLCIFIMLRLREPEKWVAARAASIAGTGKAMGSYGSLFGEARWRRPALLGMVLCVAGVIGLWGVGFFSNSLVGPAMAGALNARPLGVEQQAEIKSLLRTKGADPAQYAATLAMSRGDIVAAMMKKAKDDPAAKDAAEAVSGAVKRGIKSDSDWWAAATLIVQNIGAFFGMIVFSKTAHRFGRKPMFAVGFVCAFAATLFFFRCFKTQQDIWMSAVMGFFQLALFAGFAIYLPELFPTRLRSTGTSFCYNVGRFIAASGPWTMGVLQASLAATAIAALGSGADKVAQDAAKLEAFRSAACWLSGIYLLGLLVLPFLPETKGRPMPEDAPPAK